MAKHKKGATRDPKNIEKVLHIFYNNVDNSLPMLCKLTGLHRGVVDQILTDHLKEKTRIVNLKSMDVKCQQVKP